MILNQSKTVLVPFGTYLNSLPLYNTVYTHFDCIVDSRELCTCNKNFLLLKDNAKYLGLVIDSNLNCSMHVEKMCKRLRYDDRH